MLFVSCFIIVNLLASVANSISVVNNVTVASDILSEVFYDEIRTNLNLVETKSTNTHPYDSQKCLSSLQAILKKFPSVEVASFFDAWGKLPSGILYGNTYDIGNFDQCVKTSLTVNNDVGVVNGQFCFAKIPLKKSKNDSPVRFIGGQSIENRALGASVAINIGICLPQSCSPKLITSIFKKALENKLNGAFSGISVSKCTDGKTPVLESTNIIGIVIFSVFGLLMTLSSLYDFITKISNKSPVPVLLAFSVLTNGKKLFAINTKKSPNSIDCLTGIRVFSMVWIVYAHTYMTTSLVPAINSIDVLPWLKTSHALQVINGTLAVDSFFFISGLLVAWLGFRELDRTKGKLNIIMMYVHRYIRLTPLVAAGLLYIVSLNKLIGTGPFKREIADSDKCNGYNWWPNLLYIQNYYIQETKCFSRTWYLAVDFQLYILSPLLLIPMWKWGKKFAPMLLVLSLSSIACVMGIFIANSFTSLRGINPGEWNKTYVPMHTRCSPWLVGFALGYFMYINRQKSFRIPKIYQAVAWIISFFIFVITVYGPYFSIHANGKGTVFEAAMYEGWRRFSWAIALSWITFACHFGFGGIVASFLSHPFWQPFGRLTYALYLVHSFVLRIHFSIMRTELYFSVYEEILRFWSAFGISLLVATLVSLAFESPILVLEKFIFRNEKPKNAVSSEPLAPHMTKAEFLQKEVY